MNHAGMDHSGMDHGGMDMPSGPKCSMHMLWNTQILDTCVVFKSWHISSNTTFVLSFLAIVLIGVGYEWIRKFQTTLDRRIAISIIKGKGLSSGRESPAEDALLMGRGVAKKGQLTPLAPLTRLTRSALYGITVFISFFLMLVFMTYNAYLILAVVLGASIGNFVFGGELDVEAVLAGTQGKGMACH